MRYQYNGSNMKNLLQKLEPGVHGIALIDKPTGVTSHDVVAYVRKQTGVRKVGHAGTLDPLATGLLIVLIGRQYTKQQSIFLHAEKSYQVTAQIGMTTDTYDTDGETIATAPTAKVNAISRQDVKIALQKYQGTFQQTVPAYSAVKRNGKKLYELARDGSIDTDQLPSREVTITDLVITDWQPPYVSLSLSCSSGTYVRSLVYDVGKDLGVGATVTALRRTKISDFSVEDAIGLDLSFKSRVN